MQIKANDECQSVLRVSLWSIEKITRAIRGQLVDTSAEAFQIMPSSISTDTRAISSGALFFALSGDRFDAHAFVSEALQAGACAAVVNASRVEEFSEMWKGRVIIAVEDTLEALSNLAHELWREATGDGMKSIAVTGSNGKTTTKEILAQLWKPYGNVHFTRGNFNNHIGLPLTLCALPAHCDRLIVEMGANAQGDISHLISLAPAHQRILTSIGYAHIEGFGSLEGVARAKSEIFDRSDAHTVAIIPHIDKDKVLLEGFEGRVLTFGLEDAADLSVSIQPDTNSQNAEQVVTIKADSRRWQLPFSLPGVHNALNLACAMASLIADGMELEMEQIVPQLHDLRLPQGRWRVSEYGGFRFVDDAYNANPSSVVASVDAFVSTLDTRDSSRPVVVVLGEMLELGEDAAQWHNFVARHLANHAEIDTFIAVGTYADAMAEEAYRHASHALDIIAERELHSAAEKLFEHGSAVVFLKASRGSHLEKIVDVIREKVRHEVV